VISQGLPGRSEIRARSSQRQSASAGPDMSSMAKTAFSGPASSGPDTASSGPAPPVHGEDLTPPVQGWRRRLFRGDFDSLTLDKIEAMSGLDLCLYIRPPTSAHPAQDIASFSLSARYGAPYSRRHHRRLPQLCALPGKRAQVRSFALLVVGVLDPVLRNYPGLQKQDGGWKAWEAPDTTLEAGAHRYLARSAYASPSKVYSVLGHEGRVVPLTTWTIRDQQSGLEDGWKAWHKIDWHMLDARLPPEDQGIRVSTPERPVRS
jgi:hypothetical protein